MAATTHRRTPTSPISSARTWRIRSARTRGAAAEPDRLVKTHCCFCGQQCGIQLKVKGNQVVGFEPWEEFPFNRGMLCPKGVKRYLQGSHPDRLLSAYEREPNARSGFIAVPYNRAVEKVAEAIQRIQSAHGNDAFAVLSGASLTTEKAYLMGKFARVCLKTPLHRLQRPALHGQRRRGQQEGLRHRPRRQPVVRHPQGQGRLGQRRQHRRMRPYHDALYLASARTRGQGHHGRSAHHSRRADLRSVPARQAGPRRRPIQRHPAPDDRERLDRPRFHRGAHRRLREGRRACPRLDAAPHRRGDGDRRALDPAGGGAVGHGADELSPARPRHRASQPRRPELSRRHQHGAGVRPDRPRGLRLRHHHRPGQRPGRPRTRPEVRPAARRPRHRQPRASRPRRQGLGHRSGGIASQRRGRL